MRCRKFDGGRKNEGRLEACCGGGGAAVPAILPGSGWSAQKFTTFVCQSNARLRPIFNFFSF